MKKPQNKPQNDTFYCRFAALFSKFAKGDEPNGEMYYKGYEHSAHGPRTGPVGFVRGSDALTFFSKYFGISIAFLRIYGIIDV